MRLSSATLAFAIVASQCINAETLHEEDDLGKSARLMRKELQEDGSLDESVDPTVLAAAVGRHGEVKPRAMHHKSHHKKRSHHKGSSSAAKVNESAAEKDDDDTAGKDEDDEDDKDDAAAKEQDDDTDSADDKDEDDSSSGNSQPTPGQIDDSKLALR
eukprot:TRINITY_DN56704_c0_g1_i1.p1 TRINITY_DN56704_c0_g1~~TRINITY_DN56704_c0_g1_i1.p1  ORF type:complete len:158 (-),score=41.03 TRINITY_DN56704_c0_g1_i1:93-566(-)